MTKLLSQVRTQGVERQRATGASRQVPEFQFEIADPGPRQTRGLMTAIAAANHCYSALRDPSRESQRKAVFLIVK
jgi:hypothetical protein